LAKYGTVKKEKALEASMPDGLCKGQDLELHDGVVHAVTSACIVVDVFIEGVPTRITIPREAITLNDEGRWMVDPDANVEIKPLVN
jgi:hypothetical protein